MALLWQSFETHQGYSISFVDETSKLLQGWKHLWHILTFILIQEFIVILLRY